MQAPAAKHLDGTPDDEVNPAKQTGIALIIILIFAVDDLNPVKILCSYTRGILCTSHVAWSCTLALLILGISQARAVLYFCAKLFLRATINNIFFRSVEIIGMENLPDYGPVILTGNHNNQFVDATLLLTNCRRKISFMIAEKSWNRPFVGFLARAFHSIPVARAQDSVKKGSGTLLAVSVQDGTCTIHGDGTAFTKEVTAGCQITVAGQEKSLKVTEIISDTELRLEAETPAFPDGGCTYKILPKVDQGAMYGAVFKNLGEGRCLGIFPEGGSHDRTDLLPLKAGVAIIALDAYRKHHIRVPIIPVGLNYFKGHHFRGRVVVEFGAPIHVGAELYELHETDKRAATDALLNVVATGMRSTIVPVPDYNTLQFVYMVRRLYVQDGLKLSADQTMDLNRRFAEGIRRIGLDVERTSTPQPSEGKDDTDRSSSSPGDEEECEFHQSLAKLKEEITSYMVTLKSLGLKDHHVMQIQWWGMDHLVGRLVYVTIMMGLGAIPQLMFNLPVGLLARAFAAHEQKKALKSSSVKLAARDVLMSYKIIYCLMMVPFLYTVYIIVLCWHFGLSRTTLLFTLASPMFSFFGVKASEQGVRAWSDVVPLIMRLQAVACREQDALPSRRAALHLKVRRAVRKAGKQLGDLYTEETVDWHKETNPAAKWPGLERIGSDTSLPERKKSQ